MLKKKAKDITKLIREMLLKNTNSNKKVLNKYEQIFYKNNKLLNIDLKFNFQTLRRANTTSMKWIYKNINFSIRFIVLPCYSGSSVIIAYY